MKERIQSLLRRAPLEILATAIAFLLSLLVFSFIVHEAVYEREDVFDQAVIRFFSAHSSAGFISIMKGITFFGSTTFLFPGYQYNIGREKKSSGSKKSNSLHDTNEPC